MTTALTLPLRTIRFQVGGMDCGHCASKIETALKGHPSVAEVSVNFIAGRVEVSTHEDDGGVAAIAQTIQGLGFQVAPWPSVAGRSGHGAHACDCSHDDEDHDHDHDHHGHEAVEGPWWKNPTARLAVGLGILICAAWSLGWALPEWSHRIFAAAAILGVLPVAWQAWRQMRQGLWCSIETLMGLAVVGALIIGAAEEAAMVVFLFAIGEWIEGVAAGRARSGIRALAALMPDHARIVDEDGGIREVDADTLRPGQHLLVRPGDRVATDGEIIAGTADVDQSTVTGESVPVPLGPGEMVTAGSLVLNAALTVLVTRTVADNTLARIIEEVENAQAKKAPIQRRIDAFSRWYTPSAVVAAALVAVLPPLLVGAEWATWSYRALSLLLIACPCALVLSTPAAVASGLSAGARRGLLIKSGAALETLGNIRIMAFDKTGTLTRGMPEVIDVIAEHGEPSEVLALAAAVEAHANHPIAAAIVKATEGMALPGASEGVTEPGTGVHAMVEGRRISVVSPRSAGMLHPDPDHVRRLEAEGKTVVMVVEDGTAVLGLIALRDEPRSDAAAALDELRRMGIETVMLTGDNARTAQAVAAPLGLAVQADLLPEGKLAAIESMRRRGLVAMVGDGINDAPALAAADVGVAMGGGTEVALATADAALLGGRTSSAVDLIALARATLGNIRQNIAIALGLKGILLVTSLAGITSLWMAVIADTGSTVLVTANALRLLAWRK